MLLTRDAYYPFSGATLPDCPPIYDADAYSIVSVTYATSVYVFTHEVGHLFGCLHEVDDYNPPQGTYEHAYRFTSGWWLWKKYWITVMGNRLDKEYTKILHFSNPDVEHWSNSTGTSTANNARKLVETSCIVENLRPYTPPPSPPSVYISGPVKGFNNVTYTWKANGSGGQPPYTYQWQYSLDGTKYSPFGTGPSVTGNLPLDFDLYLKVTITDSNKQQSSDFFVTINMGDSFKTSSKSISESQGSSKIAIEPLITNNHSDNEIIETTSQQAVYPNPAKNNANVQYTLKHPGKVQISIVNSLGIMVQLHKIDHQSSGIFNKTLQLDPLNNGIYFINVVSGENKKIYKLVISK